MCSLPFEPEDASLTHYRLERCEEALKDFPLSESYQNKKTKEKEAAEKTADDGDRKRLPTFPYHKDDMTEQSLGIFEARRRRKIDECQLDKRDGVKKIIKEVNKKKTKRDRR